MIFGLAIYFRFSKTYDLITFGPYANRVAKTIASLSSNNMSMLTIQEQNYVIEPSLIPFTSPKLQLCQKNHEFSDVQMGVGLQDIKPQRNQVTLKNGSKYNYRILLYSGNSIDWRKNPYLPYRNRKNASFIHTDYYYEGMDQLFARRGGSIVFTIPKPPHFGNQNYFMLLLQQQMKKRKSLAPFKTQEIQIIIICEGNSLIQYNVRLNQIVEEYLERANIKVIKNTRYVVDQQKRVVKLAGTRQQIKFCSLFQYQQIKVPEVLQNANINPFDINRHSLNHTKFENIYLLGNFVNNVYSFGAIEKMSKVIAHNIISSKEGLKKKALYQGESSIYFWVNKNQCHYVQTDYNGIRLKKDLGIYSFWRNIVAQKQKYFLTKNLQRKVNSGSCFYSIFNEPETISTQRQLLPVLINDSFNIN